MEADRLAEYIMATTSPEKRFWSKFSDELVRFMWVMDERSIRSGGPGLSSEIKTEVLNTFPTKLFFGLEYYPDKEIRKNTRRKLRPAASLRENFFVNRDQKEALELLEYQQEKYKKEIELSCSEIDFERSSFGNVVYKWETRDENINFYDWYPDFDIIDGVRVARTYHDKEYEEEYKKCQDKLFVLEQVYDRYMRYGATSGQKFDEAVFGYGPIYRTQEEYIADMCRRSSPSGDMDFNDYCQVFVEDITRYVQERHHMYRKVDQDGNKVTPIKYEISMGPLDLFKRKDGNLNDLWIKWIVKDKSELAINDLKAMRNAPTNFKIYTEPVWVPYRRPYYYMDDFYPTSMDDVKDYLDRRFGALPKWDGSERDLPPLCERDITIYKLPYRYEPPSVEDVELELDIQWDEMLYFNKVNESWAGYEKPEYPIVTPLPVGPPGRINYFPDRQGYMPPKSLVPPDYSKYLVPPKWYYEMKKNSEIVDVEEAEVLSVASANN